MRGLGVMEALWAAANGDADEFVKSGDSKAIAIGTGFGVLSAIANGSFTVFSKLNSVKRANVDPLVFNFWACVGIVLSSFVVLVWTPFVWSPLGLISGLFFVLSAANSYRAVGLIGVSVGTGLWSGTSVLVSFVGGLLFDPSDTLSSLLFAILAIVIILLGIGGVAYAGHVGRMAAGQEEDLRSMLNSESSGGTGKGNFVAGTFSALFAGVLGGLILIPMTRAEESVQGVSYLPSFAIGVAVSAPIVNFIPYCTTIRQMPNFAPGAAALPGIISGIVWNIGNTFSIVAMDYISYSLAYPIMQTGIFVAGLWGLLLFDEIAGKGAIMYWLAGVVVLIGVGVLAFAH